MRRTLAELRMWVTLRLMIVTVTVAGSVMAAGVIWPRSAMTAEPVTIMVGQGLQFAAGYVADKEKFFEKEGVAVSIKFATSGKVGVDSMVAGSGVMAISGIFPAVSAAATAPVYIIAPVSIEDGDTKLVVAPGIKSAADLKGKRVGYKLGSDGHLFILRYLEKFGMDLEDIISQNVPPPGLVAAFSRGDLDAVAVWEPIAGKALKSVPDATVLAAKGVVPIYNPVSMRKDFAESQPETARKLVKALVAATDFINENPDRAAQVAAEVTKLELGEVKRIMSTYTYTMTIDPAFYTGMDNVAAFLQKRKLTKTKADPRKFVFEQLMREASPSHVE